MAEEKKKLHLKNNEIEELVSLYRERKSKISGEKTTSDFEVKKTRETYINRIKLKEKVYHLSIARKSSANFIAFIQSLSIVFNYLLNAARSTVNCEDDYVRFIFQTHRLDISQHACYLLRNLMLIFFKRV